MVWSSAIADSLAPNGVVNAALRESFGEVSADTRFLPSIPHDRDPQ